MPKKPPEVIVFDGTSLDRPKCRDTKFAYKSFMSSKISKLDRQPTAPKSLQEQKDEALQRENDRQLQELLEGHHMVERLNESQLSGKERHKYQKEKLARLGMKAKQKEKMPADMYFNTERARQKRADKAIKDAKDRGILNNAMKRGLERTYKVKQPKAAKKVDRGLQIDAPGKYVDGGMLMVSKRHIAKVNGSGAGKTVGIKSGKVAKNNKSKR